MSFEFDGIIRINKWIDGHIDLDDCNGNSINIEQDQVTIELIEEYIKNLEYQLKVAKEAIEIKKKDKIVVSGDILREIIYDLGKEELFERVDKEALFKYLYSKISVLPKYMIKDDLIRRIRKIMAIEAMSHIFYGDKEVLNMASK